MQLRSSSSSPSYAKWLLRVLFFAKLIRCTFLRRPIPTGLRFSYASAIYCAQVASILFLFFRYNRLEALIAKVRMQSLLTSANFSHHRLQTYFDAHEVYPENTTKKSRRTAIAQVHIHQQKFSNTNVLKLLVVVDRGERRSAVSSAFASRSSA